MIVEPTRAIKTGVFKYFESSYAFLNSSSTGLVLDLTVYSPSN